MNLLKEIIKWNRDRNNVDYDSTVEFAMLQEEVLEYAHSYILTVSDMMGIDVLAHKVDTEEESREINEKISELVETEEFKKEWEVNQADALADTIFADGLGGGITGCLGKKAFFPPDRL